MGLLGAIGSFIGGGLGIGQTISGIIGNNKANKQYKKAQAMQRGDYDLQDEFVDNYNRAGLNSLSGIPAAQKAMLMQNVMRSANKGLNTSNLTRNSSAAIGQIQQNQDDAYNQLMAQDSQQRLANQGNLAAAATSLGNQKVAKNAYESALSEKDRDRELGRAEQAKAAAQQNIWGGISGIAGAIPGLGGLFGGKKNAAPMMGPYIDNNYTGQFNNYA